MFFTDFTFDGNELVFVNIELMRLKDYSTVYIQASTFKLRRLIMLD